MAEFAHDLDAQRRLRDIEKKMAEGGPPTDNGHMEARVKALEEAVKNLPTKTDFAELRADMAEGREAVHKLLVENSRWTHTALVSMLSVCVIGILGLLFTIWNASKGVTHQAPSATVQQPYQQPPIIINVPAAQSTPAAPPQQ